MPITVSMPIISTIVAARYMSSPKSDSSSIGPSVGKLRTTDTITLPDSKKGSKYRPAGQDGIGSYFRRVRVSERWLLGG